MGDSISTELSASSVRARLDFSYDGAGFSGWAAQPGLRTVQGELDAALTRIVRAPDGAPMTVALTVAGRTDAGVHARHQVAHVDIPVTGWERLAGRGAIDPAQGLRRRLDGLLPPDIIMRSVRIAPPGFDARFSATQRRYAYRLCDDAALRDPLTRGHVVWHDRPLDVDAMNAAGSRLTGLRDFAPFCRPREGATTIRDLLEFSWQRVSAGPDEGLVVATVRADAFCHSMVRSLVGAVLAVGDGRKDLPWLEQEAAGRRRSSAFAVAPAHGLSLEHVAYPPDAELAQRAGATRARREPLCGESPLLDS